MILAISALTFLGLIVARFAYLIGHLGLLLWRGRSSWWLLLLFVVGLLAVGALTLTAANAATRTHCRQSYSHARHYARPYTGQHHGHHYAVGIELREEAVAERIARRVQAKLDARAAKAKTPHDLAAASGERILKTACLACHVAGAKAVTDGAPELFTREGQLKIASQLERSAVLAAIKEQRMPPPPAEGLSDDDYLAVKTLLDR